MTPLYVAYTPATGWTLITPDYYGAPLAPGECRVRRANMAGGAQIHVRTIADAAKPDWTGEPQIGRRAAQWLVESGYARKHRGALVIDDRKVAADTANFPVEMMSPEFQPAPIRRVTPMDILNLAPPLDLTADDFRELSFAVYGITRSGKGNATAVIVEELYPYMPFAIIDPQGEYHGLRQLTGARTFGKAVSAKVDIAIKPYQGAQVADYLLRERRPVILDLSEFDDDPDNDERMALADQFLRRLWQGTSPDKVTGTVLLVIDEAHNFAPQQGKTPMKYLLRRFVKEGLGRGVVTGVVTQRPVDIDKGVSMQCALQIMLNVVGTNDLKRYADMIPGKLMSASQVEDVAFNLQRGEALVLRHKKLDRVQFRVRHTPHGRHTPQFAANYVPPEPAPDSPELAALREAFAMPVTNEDDTAALRAEISRLNEIIKAKDERIAELEAELAAARPVFGVDWGSTDTAAAAMSLINPETGKAEIISEQFARNGTPEMVSEVGSFGLDNGISPRALVPTLITSPDGTPFNADPLEDSIAKRERDTTARLVRKQERDFADLLETVRRWLGSGKRGNWQRDFLVLLQRHGTVSRAQAVSWLRISAATFTSNPPTAFEKAGLIRVSRNRGNYVYTWNAQQRLALAFPDLDARELERKLLA